MLKNKKILFVTDSFGYGGAVKQLVFVAEGLLNRGWQVAILNLNQDKGSGDNRSVNKNIQLFVANIQYGGTVKYNCDLVRYAIKVTRQYEPDIIVGFTEIPNFCVAVAGCICRTPSIISERVDPFVTYKNARLPLRIKLWCINKSAGAVFQTQRASEFYSTRLRKNSAVIPNPVFINEQLPSIDYEHLPQTIISLGRLDNHQKRFDVMLRAFAKFHVKHPEYVLKIYGSGKDEDIIRQWIGELNLQDSVNMMGVSSHPLQDFCHGGIFLITSDYEGISNALLEAMACGLPVVATDHTPGGARLLIRDKENGLLVPMRDENAISDALSKYAENTALLTKCGSNAKQVLSEYAPERILDLWESYINKLIH